MKKVSRLAMMIIASTTISMGLTACGDDDETPATTATTPATTPATTQPTAEQVRDSLLFKVNSQYLNKTIIATYKKLATDCENMLPMAQGLNSQAALNKLCDQWKLARQDWELSESFLFGAASGYGIDPHIDTWPFAEASFVSLMSRLMPATDEADAENVRHMIATTQNFTGFHAMEYVIFRNGQPRNYSDLTADEKFFVLAVAEDLYLSACRLEVAWASVDAEPSRITLLEEAEMTPDAEFGKEFLLAGERGSRWSSVLDATVQIIDGCIDIIGEVADSKIAAAYSGNDETYIESPHAYNSIQDFYDNIRGCKQALYGGLDQVNATTPAQNSLMAYCLTAYPTEARAAMAAMETALTAINQMKRPFVLNYTDPSAGKAIDALHSLDDALGALKQKLDPNAETE